MMDACRNVTGHVRNWMCLARKVMICKKQKITNLRKGTGSTTRCQQTCEGSVTAGISLGLAGKSCKRVLLRVAKGVDNAQIRCQIRGLLILKFPKYVKNEKEVFQGLVNETLTPS